MKSFILIRVLALALILFSLLMPQLFIESRGQTLNPSILTTNTAYTTDVLIDPSEWFVEDFIQPTTLPITLPSTLPTTESATTESTSPALLNPSKDINWYGEYRTYATGEITTQVAGESVNVEFLAKLLFAEAAISSRLGQIYTCSAILNFCDYENISLWEAGHDVGCFAVAPYVDEMEPTEEIYEVIEYVLNGGRIADICYFRTKRYHSFGSPICQIDGQYFSKP